jgi:hypothetical protein
MLMIIRNCSLICGSYTTAYFTDLGEEAAGEITRLWAQMRAQAGNPPGEDYLHRVARLNALRKQAEEVVLANPILLSPGHDAPSLASGSSDRAFHISPPGRGHQHRGLVPGVFPASPPGALPCLARHRRAGQRGGRRGRAVQQERERGAARRSAGVPPRSAPAPRHPGACPGRARDARRGRGARRAGRPRPGWSWSAADRCPTGLSSRFRFPAAVLIPWHA